MSRLVNGLNVLIAQDLGIKPEGVTLELIRDWRENHKCAYLTVHPHGGQIVEGLQVLDPSEEQDALEEADKMLVGARA